MLVAPPVAVRALAAAGDDEHAVVDGYVDLVGVDARELGDDVEDRRVLRAIDVDSWAEPRSLRRKPVIPEVGEELLHLAREAVDVPPLSHARIVAMGRFLTAGGVGFGFLVYVWVAAVRAAPGIRARKAANRAVRRS